MEADWLRANPLPYSIWKRIGYGPIRFQMWLLIQLFFCIICINI